MKWKKQLCAAAAVLLALRLLKKKNAPKHWSRLLTGLTAAGMAVIFGAMGYIAVQGQDSIMAQDETPAFIVVLGAQVQGDGPSLTLKKRLDKTLEFLQARCALCRALCELLFFLLELRERLLAALLLLAVERHLLSAALPFLLEHRALQGFFLHALAERHRVLLDVLEV